MYDILNVYLENGLRVVMHRIPYVRTMACGLWVKQGSKYENDENNGISHFIEHLLINTENNLNQRSKKLINEVVSEGVIYNAATTKEFTSFYFTGLTNMLDRCIETLSSIVINNTEFETSFFENEKKIVTQEAINFYSSFNQIKERTTQALWGNVGIGKIIVGDIQNIKNTKIEDVQEIIEGAYVPENCTIVVIGGIDYQKTLDMIEDYFAAWVDKQTRKVKELVNSDPSIYFNNGSTGESTAISVGFKTVGYSDNQRYGVDIITKILGDVSLESRLCQEIRIKRGLAYTVGGFANFYESRGTVGFTAVCSNKSVKEVVKLMIEQFNKAKDLPFTELEVNRARKILETKTLLDLDDLTSQLKFLGKCASYGQLFSLENEIRNIQKLDNCNLNALVNDMFVENNMSLSVIGKCNIDEVLPLLEISA